MPKLERADHLSGAAFQFLVAGMLIGATFKWDLGPFLCALAWFPLRWACARVVRAVEAGEPDDFGQHDA